MIENIRKYTGLMIVVFVLLFVSFLLLDTSSVQNIGGGGSVLRVDGRSYNDKEYRRIGMNGLALTQELISSGNYDLYQFLLASTMDAREESGAEEKFFVTRILLQSAAEEFGLQPGEEEISARIRSMQSFTGPDGDFDAQKFSTFLDRRIGRLGMAERDVRAVVSDILIFEKLGDVVGSGLAPLRDTVVRNHALQSQRISGAVAHFELAPFEEAVEPTEDDVRAFWENLQDAFVTEQHRRFTYIVAKPDLPADISAEEEELPTFSFEDLALSEEERAAKDAQHQAELAAKRAEERRTKQRELDLKVDDFLYQLEQKPEASFEELAGEKGFEVKTSELFPQSAPPADLAVALRQSSNAGQVVVELFQIEADEDPFSRISRALPVGEGEWIIARLDETELSRVKTFEEAREEARALYIEDQAVAAMTEAAEAAVGKIKEALAAGQTFAEAAEAAGMESVHAFEDITSAHQPDPATEPQALFETARVITPGTVADVLIESDRAFILYVGEREVVRDENIDQTIDTQLAQMKRANESTALVAWMRARTEAADVQQLWKNR